MTRLLPVSAVALSLLAAGCAAGVPLHSAPVPAINAGAWAELRDGASRRKSLYDGFVHRADASATWLSPGVREESVRRLAEWQAWNDAELEQGLARARADALRGEEFLLAFYTADIRANDLDARPSVWHLELDDGATRNPATEITALTTDATVRYLYPYVGPFDVVYRVRFKWSGSSLEGRPFRLRVAGSLGEVSLDFGPEGERTHLPSLPP